MLRGPVSIRMVAERAGVSIATVSNVLNGKSSVSQSLAQRVRAAVDELGYAANSHASRLRSGKHALAGVLVPDLSNPVFGGFVSSLERLAQDDGFELLVGSTAEHPAREAERLKALWSWRPSGLILVPCDGNLRERLGGRSLPPVVVVDRVPDHPGFDLVAVDNALAASAITAHLVDQGYESCLVLASTLAITNVRERWEGALAGAGAMPLELLEATMDLATVRERLLERFARRPRPAALFALDNQSALVAYRTLDEMGFAVPSDIAFASFDESEWMRLVSPPVTAVRQPVRAMATLAWERLKRAMAGDPPPPDLSRLTCAIEFRGSTPRRAPRPAPA